MTGGFDRNIRVWHIPDRKATAWAHLNDAVTAVGCQRVGRSWGSSPGSVSVQEAARSSSTSQRSYPCRCDEMVLGTMRAGAFNEAERCGAAGIRAQSNALQGIVAGSASPRKRWRGLLLQALQAQKKTADLQAESEARRRFLSGTDEDTKVEEQSTMTKATIVLKMAIYGNRTDRQGRVDRIREYRASSISLPRRGRAAVLREQRRAGLYDAMNPRRTLKPLLGAVLGLWSAAACLRTRRARSASGARRRGKSRLEVTDVGTSKPEALPLEIDVKARNARSRP